VQCIHPNQTYDNNHNQKHAKLLTKFLAFTSTLKLSNNRLISFAALLEGALATANEFRVDMKSKMNE